MILKDITSHSPESVMLQLPHLPYLSQALYTAAKLNIADCLADGPKSSEEIAQSVNAHPYSLYRLLRALAGLGIFAEDEQGRFSLTQFGETLRTDIPNSIHGWCLFNGEPWRWEILADTVNVVRDGKTPYEHFHQKSIYEFLRENEPEAQLFNSGVKAWSTSIHKATVDTYDFSSFQTVVDVAGGMGNFITMILQKNPGVRGIYFDQPAVAEIARQNIAATDIADRCQITSGNFFEGVPEGGDAYTISFVLMDWFDEQIVQILKNCHRAMNPNGKLLVLEALIGPPNEPCFGKLVDILAMVETGGNIRTADEHRNLMEQAGFTLTKVIPTNIPSLCFLEATKVNTIA